MAANSYYTSLEADTAYAGGRPGHNSHNSTSSMKPFKMAGQAPHGAEYHGMGPPGGRPGGPPGGGLPGGGPPGGFPGGHPGAMFDKKMKARIRKLRIIQRVIAILISIAALVPLAMTLHKYLTTRDDFRDTQSAAGTIVNRNPWSLKNKTWPTYMYFSSAVISLMIHLSVLFGYLLSVKTSNMLDNIGTWVVSVELAGQFILWVVVTVIYKYQKEKVEAGRHNDLWGWTCSGPAQTLQTAFDDVIEFKKFCDIQSAGWYAGLVQIGAIVLAIVIMVLGWRRKKSAMAAGRARAQAQRGGPPGKDVGKESFRHQAV